MLLIKSEDHIKFKNNFNNVLTEYIIVFNNTIINVVDEEAGKKWIKLHSEILKNNN